MGPAGRWDEVVDSSRVTEQERLALLERLFDLISICHLDRFGIRPGRRCLEAGVDRP